MEDSCEQGGGVEEWEEEKDLQILMGKEFAFETLGWILTSVLPECFKASKQTLT